MYSCPLYKDETSDERGLSDFEIIKANYLKLRTGDALRGVLGSRREQRAGTGGRYLVVTFRRNR